MEKQGHRETKASQRQKPTFAVAVNGSLAVSAADAAINALHWVLAQPQAIFQNVHHDLELTEDQHLQYRFYMLFSTSYCIMILS